MIHLPQAIGNVISSISIGIGTAAANSIGYQAPAQYQSNPSHIHCYTYQLALDVIPLSVTTESLLLIVTVSNPHPLHQYSLQHSELRR